MTDFYQEGTITTFHDLYRAFDPDEYLVNLEEKLEQYSRKIKVSLLLPSLYSELENSDALDKIIDKIKKVKYLKNVIVALGGSQEEENFLKAKEYFSTLQTSKRTVKVVWVDGPRVQEIFKKIKERNILTGVQGKGQSVWITLGYLLARGDSHVIALHGCDIGTYLVEFHIPGG